MNTKNYLSIYAKSFNWSGFFLPKKIYSKCSKLYDFCRTIDNIADQNSELKNLEKSIVRTDILKNKNRIDGRGLSDVRPIMCEVGILPRVHGSALFTRGETQAIVTTTLGTSDDEQRIGSRRRMLFTISR